MEDDHVYLQGEQGKTYFDNCDVQVAPRYLKLQSPSGDAHVKPYEVSHFAHGCKVRGHVDIRKLCFDFEFHFDVDCLCFVFCCLYCPKYMLICMS